MSDNSPHTKEHYLTIADQYLSDAMASVGHKSSGQIQILVNIANTSLRMANSMPSGD